MAFKEGEVYRCGDPECCGCEFTVTKGSKPSCTMNENPRCCCGKEMMLVEEKKAKEEKATAKTNK